jgi:hypothetical protein
MEGLPSWEESGSQSVKASRALLIMTGASPVDRQAYWGNSVGSIAKRPLSSGPFIAMLSLKAARPPPERAAPSADPGSFTASNFKRILQSLR